MRHGMTCLMRNCFSLPARPGKGASGIRSSTSFSNPVFLGVTQLEMACREIGGHLPESTFSYDLCMQFNALPKIPVLVLFNDTDDEFPAQCAVLFERRAEKYLDMECLAMVGMLLFEYLKLAVDNPVVRPRTDPADLA